MTAVNKWNLVIHDMFMVKLCSHPQQISKQADDLIKDILHQIEISNFQAKN